MPRVCYQPRNFKPESLDTIARAIGICEDYESQGFQLTLRQLYYQFVSRGYIENSDRSYKNLGNIVNDARMAGLIDWNHLEDRTRNMVALAHWSSPADIVGSSARSYRTDRWANQPIHVEVWVEKEALASVIAVTAQRNDVPYIACRGYMSQSEMWSRAMAIVRSCKGKDRYGSNRQAMILHLGDHDPSGIDMSRDIQDRLSAFCSHHGFYDVIVERIALTMDQIDRYQPPPNPAKITDSRAVDYIKRYGAESWELDALSPTVLDDLIQDWIDRYRDDDLDRDVVRTMEKDREVLTIAAKYWDEVSAELETRYGSPI